MNGSQSDPSTKPRIVIICGPTGIGKTSIAVELARDVGGEIVSADSMQVYRRMNIGTATPSADEQAAVRHHLIDVVDPDEAFDAAEFARRAHAVIADIAARHLIPFVVGGTGLYIKALLYGLFRARPADPDVLARLRREAKDAGAQRLHDRLRQRDPASAGRIHPNDTFRIVRALEVIESTGEPVSAHRRRHGFTETNYQAFKIGLTMDREALYARIDARVEVMLRQGLLKEVERLVASGYSPDLKSMQSIGYRHMLAFCAGETTWQEAVDTLKRDSRRYAKRQFTWFRADDEITWYHPEQLAEMKAAVSRFLK